MTNLNEKIELKYLIILPEDQNSKESLFNVLRYLSTLDFHSENNADFITLNKNFKNRIDINNVNIKNKYNNKSNFIVSLSFDELKYAKSYSKELNKINNNIKNINIELLHDGISRYYSIQAYKILHEVETTLRAFITKLMVFYSKDDWHKNIGKVKINNNNNRSNEGIKILYDTDFNQLRIFLFEVYNGTDYKDIVKKLLNEESDDEKLRLLRELENDIPKTYWDKLIANQVNKHEISGEEFQKLLTNIYNKRNKIAHCNNFVEEDYNDFKNNCERVLQLTKKLTKIIEAPSSNFISQDKNLSEDLNVIFSPSDEYDTIIVPAKEDGFNKVFLDDKMWYSVAIYKNRIKYLKYIAAYITNPTQEITHYAEIDRIEPSELEKNKYIIYFKDKPKHLPSKIPLGDARSAFQRSRYTSFDKLKIASTTDDLFES